MKFNMSRTRPSISLNSSLKFNCIKIIYPIEISKEHDSARGWLQLRYKRVHACFIQGVYNNFQTVDLPNF